jgi:NDP-sugar pyrophosphorylase family protein
MIEHSIGVLRSGGIEEIIINLHHKPESIKSILGDGSRMGVSISYSYEDPLLGSGGGIGKVREFFEDEPFAVLNSDIIIDIDLKEVIESHQQSEAAATLVLREDVEERYGEVRIDETGRVRKIEGHPKRLDFHGGKNYMFAGLHIIEPVWFDYTPDKQVYESFPDVYAPMMLDGNAVNSFILEGRWIDIGSARRYLEASLDQLIGNIIPNKSHKGCDCVIENSILTDNTVLGENVRLKGVIFVGGAEIGSNCSLEECIICPEATVAEGTTASRRVFYEDKSVALSDIRD